MLDLLFNEEMNKALKFVVFLGTTREGRLGERAAKFILEKIKSRGHQVEFFGESELLL